jgi:hypothetical protein
MNPAMQHAAWAILPLALLTMQGAGAADDSGPAAVRAWSPEKLVLTSSLGAIQMAAAEQVPAVGGRSGEPGPVAAATQGTGAAQAGAPTPWWSPQNLVLLRELGVESWADVPHLGNWGGSLDLSIDGNKQLSRSPDNTEFKSSGRLTTEGLTIRNQGFYLVDPRLLTGTVGLRFALQQSNQTAGGVQTGQNGLLTGYNLDTTLLGEKPYSTTLFANRSQNLTTQLSGGSTRSDNENRALVFRWREDSILRDKQILPYFSATVQARQEHTREVSTLGDQVFRRDEQRSLFGVSGHNGSETADLDFRVENSNLDNLLYPAGSYGSQLANVGYSRDFGPNLNRRSDTRVDYSSRSGSSVMSILNLNQRLSIEHYENLSTAYNYGYTQQVAENGTSTAQSGGMQLQHRLYNNLVSSLGLAATQQVLPNGSIDTKSAQAGFNYNHAIPWNGQLSAALGGSTQITNSQLQSSQIPVLNVSYQAPAPLGAGASFLLNDSFIDANSIIVVDVRGGARLATTVGTDYLVVVEGNRTRIQPQPTSLVILPGDPLEVSYLYNFDPSLKFQTTSRSMSLGADWRWIAVSVSHDETLQNALSGSSSQYLTNRRSDAARMDLRGNWETLQARADGTVSRYNYTQLIYDELRLNQHLAYSPRDNLLLSLSANQSRANYQLPVRESEGRSMRLDVDWATRSGWLTTAYLSRRVLRDTQMPTDMMTEAAIRFTRRWAKLTIAGNLGLVERNRGGVQTTNTNLRFTAIRDF